MLFLENTWAAEPHPAGTWILRLSNLADEGLAGFTLSVTSITRVLEDHVIQGGRLLTRHANFHEFAPPEGFTLAPGQAWEMQIEGLNRSPFHRNDAAKTAWVTQADGQHIAVQVGDLMQGSAPPGLPPPRLPEGRLTLPFALIPWPNEIEAVPGPAPVLLHLDPASSLADKRLALSVDALHARLYPAARRVIQLSPAPGSRGLAFEYSAAIPVEGFRLDFGPTITLSASSEAGRRYGLIALAQMLHGAFADPKFLFPATGYIQDAPRYGWRGCHLDCSRHFWRFDQVCRVVDIMAWQRLNMFHWHLTDDEGWRAEIRAYPSLTTVGATRAAGLSRMPPQLGDSFAPVSGFYSQDQMRALVAHAGGLGVEVMPEIETPGHAICITAALPHLVDPDEPAESYHPVQGFPNNSWNPGVPETFTVLETIIDELCEIFPSRWFHIGGDEVARNAWLESPRARVLMQREGLAGTFELQSWFLNRIKALLDARGKVLVGWNEVAHGGGVSPEGTLLMAWEKPEVGIALAREGYDVVMTPGQAYYLDMVQGPDWLENGAGWAGPVTPEQSYTYEAAGEFPADLAHHMKGVQACIWCEHFTTDAWFNDLVFPRLLAVAEAAWTNAGHKDWQRFAAQARLHPLL
ncbi:beta-N-acetylhexosaminidase [Xinfangfangia sp. D13-10-4-6]|uniref:beta-N-acetylhexosaminidase n=1 Tax=Pseudogemmobacter hezensis TaxID=2737662 RepID=UPI0015583406|nr:family 20 glycosylhydrolase [Pseudogemmobacter hezensis]NPD16017.1 beta-N-acetylhexosaminidase [Pseudogemmobacter hezensis]